MVQPKNSPETLYSPMAVDAMKTLIVCRGLIAFKTIQVYRACHWPLPHVIVSEKEWIAFQQCAAPWILNLPHDHVHLVNDYTDIDSILSIATKHHLDAIYPGYGFLAESASFCERTQQAGLRFIGPNPQVLRTLGDKAKAVALAQQIGIPTIPGDDGLIHFARAHTQMEIREETVRQTMALARRHSGCAIRIKSPVGGGGKGQQVVSTEDLQAPDARERIVDALAKVWAESGVLSNSGDSQKGVLLEIDIIRPLHWEVQIFGDGDSVVHFAGRDCSIQNQGHQKFIESSLHSGALDAAIQKLDREADAKRIAKLERRKAILEDICAYALKLGEAIQLRGAATVEFLIDEQMKPYFLEVNPRIQVEHGVTEAIAHVRGKPVSLVELQQRVAAGEKFDFEQSDITFAGDAMEVRVNAWKEDLRPVLGGIVNSVDFELPPKLKGDVRIEAGGLLQRRTPWVVPNYDANFLLIIVSSPNRQETLKTLLTILEDALYIDGNVKMQTNVQPLIGLLTLMLALPPDTEFRSDMCCIWVAMVAAVAAHETEVTQLVPKLRRKWDARDDIRYARVIAETISAAFSAPSRLLTFYIQRLTDKMRRPLVPLETLFQLAEYLGVRLYREERHQKDALQKAIGALWALMGYSRERFQSFCETSILSPDNRNEYQAVLEQIFKVQDKKSRPAASESLQHFLGLIECKIPAINALIEAFEKTRLHVLLSANADLTLNRLDYLDSASALENIQQQLRRTFRPMELREGVVLSPMAAVVYLQAEFSGKPFISPGENIKAGQRLALLEAMKMLTDLNSPIDGTLVDILVSNGQAVKEGTPLFKFDINVTKASMEETLFTKIKNRKYKNRFGLLFT